MRRSKIKYCLSLANGQEWQFVSTKETEDWLNRLTSIMELTPCKDTKGSKLIFACGESSQNKINEILLSLDSSFGLDSWKCRDIKFLRFWHSDFIRDVVCEFKFPYADSSGVIDTMNVWRMYHVMRPIYERVKGYGGVPIHAALVEIHNYGVLISASGGTGKSTCCTRIQQPWRAICDDESLVLLDKQSQYMVHPIPTWGSLLEQDSNSWDVQRAFPLRAIFFLERSEFDEVAPIGQGQASVLINDAVSWIWFRSLKNTDRQEKIKLSKEIFDNSCRIARSLPTFMLRASLTGKFWKVMEKALETI